MDGALRSSRLIGRHETRNNGMQNIGFIGIGAMGWHMAGNLCRAGHRVTVHDADPARQQRFALERNARAAQSLAQLGAAADVVITMLPTGPIVRQVLEHQEDGALARTLRKGAIVVDMSSSEPAGTRELASRL
jgi:3-hydroxyisobutyrate dehydrogenase